MWGRWGKGSICQCWPQLQIVHSSADKGYLIDFALISALRGEKADWCGQSLRVNIIHTPELGNTFLSSCVHRILFVNVNDFMCRCLATTFHRCAQTINYDYPEFCIFIIYYLDCSMCTPKEAEAITIRLNKEGVRKHGEAQTGIINEL